MTNVISVQQFLVGNTFTIPHYQRDYAWTIREVEDLLGDIEEAITHKASHYLGTIVLATNDSRRFEVVDGQQRLCTLSLIVHALLSELPSDNNRRIEDNAILLKTGSELKVDFGNNESFVYELFKGTTPSPETSGQRNLFKAYSYARERAQALHEEGGADLILGWLETIKNLELINFVANETGRAIRMFQTINDRGLPLTAMDKAKALLVLYSNRHLDGELDSMINECFGSCFSAFDTIREFADQDGFRINNIARGRFSEDDLLRYHYLSYNYPGITMGNDYEGTISTVYDGFLKGTLKQLASDSDKLRSFIKDYIKDLSDFCDAFRKIVLKTENDERLYKYFVILGVSARLSPLTFRLYQRNMLFNTPYDAGTDLLKCLETADVRVYKTRGTDPGKDIGVISHRSREASAQEIADSLRDFTSSFMPNWKFQGALRNEVYQNRALSLVLVEYDEHRAGESYDAVKLQELVKNQITREHILSQTPSFGTEDQGFENENDFEQHLNLLGNLTLLTQGENTKCRNVNVYTKMTDKNLYPSSRYASTRLLAQEFNAGSQRFTKDDLKERTDRIANWTQQQWPLW